MAKSILQNEKRCFISGSTTGLQRHHIYGASNRNISEENGFWVWLRHDYHIADSPNKTPHNCRMTDLCLKEMCQREYEKNHSREDFIKLIGRSYL